MTCRRLIVLIGISALMVSACDSNNDRRANSIVIDGSNTVYPLSGAFGEEYQAKTGTNLTVAVSGTGGGFQSFCRGETDITGASRPIRDSELQECQENGIEFIEIPIAYDGLTVTVHPDNDWVEAMTVAELKKLWEPDAQGTITTWRQIRDEWPDEEISLFGNTTDNGTYDYFTQAIVGEQHASRGDYTASVDSNVLIRGIAGDRNSLGFFAYAYYYENQDQIKSVAIKTDEQAPAVRPNRDSIKDGTYQPLTRPMFYYISAEAAEREEIQKFVDFIVNEGASLIESVGYVPLPEQSYELMQAHFDTRSLGTAFDNFDGAEVGLTADDLLTASAPAGDGP